VGTLEQHLLLCKLSSRVIKNRDEIMRTKEAMSLSEEGFIVTGKWVGREFQINITRDQKCNA